MLIHTMCEAEKNAEVHTLKPPVTMPLIHNTITIQQRLGFKCFSLTMYISNSPCISLKTLLNVNKTIKRKLVQVFLASIKWVISIFTGTGTPYKHGPEEVSFSKNKIWLSQSPNSKRKKLLKDITKASR